MASESRAFSTLFRDKSYINGAWVGGPDGATFEVKNPANGKVIANVANLGDDETQKAIDAAHEAFKTWRWTTARERAALLRKWFDLCQANVDELAKILTAEQGKPLAEAKGECGYGNGFLEWFAEETKRINGDVIPAVASSKQQMFIRQPIGVAGIITPWNFPNAMITRKLGAAIASGCTVVCRPAEDTPLSALAVIALAEEAGFPKGVINIVTSDRGNAASIGKVICKSPKEALDFANDSRVGLAGYFYSNDMNQCWRVAHKMEVGMVGINEGMMSCPEGAFGGVKESGLGREGSKYGIDEFTEMKYLCFGNLKM